MQSHHPNHMCTSLIRPCSSWRSAALAFQGLRASPACKPTCDPSSNIDTIAACTSPIGGACQEALTKSRPTTPYNPEPPTTAQVLMARRSKAVSPDNSHSLTNIMAQPCYPTSTSNQPNQSPDGYITTSSPPTDFRNGDRLPGDRLLGESEG